MLQRSPAKSKTRRRARIEALDTLPVFFKLEGVRVLVIGGTAAAAWKAELRQAQTSSGSQKNLRKKPRLSLPHRVLKAPSMRVCKIGENWT